MTCLQRIAVIAEEMDIFSQNYHSYIVRYRHAHTILFIRLF